MMWRCMECGRDLMASPPMMVCEKCRFWLDTGDGKTMDLNQTMEALPPQAQDQMQPDRVFETAVQLGITFSSMANTLGETGYDQLFLAELSLRSARYHALATARESPEIRDAMSDLLDRIDAAIQMCRRMKGKS